MATAKEVLQQKVEQLGEEEARQILDLMTARESPLGTSTKALPPRQAVRERLAGRPGFRLPPDDALPFRRFRPIQCPGVPASELLIADRR